MPVITVEMYEGRTIEQKRELSKAITEAVVRIAKTTPEATFVVFTDVDKGDWAQGGLLASE